MTKSPKVSEQDVGRGHAAHARPALVLVNLGTPDEPTPRAVRHFLREFLSDRRVVEMHPLLWRPILEGIILRFRPYGVAKKYKEIWMEGGSPLLVGTRAQTTALRELLGAEAEVRYAMRYGSDNIQTVLSDLYHEGFRHVAIVPTYPQYSASTVGAIYDEVARWQLQHRDQMNVRLVRSYEDAPEYIEALASALETHWERVGRPDFGRGDVAVASFHSIPVAMRDKGDPYHSECETTADLLRKRLGLTERELRVTYQSVFGPAQWIGPATIDTMSELGEAHVKRVDVICPGFVADCLETLEEIGEQNRDAFLEAGGEEFHYVPWANGEPLCVKMLEAQARKTLMGWKDLSGETQLVLSEKSV
ncbi:MAG: ferrochelatase [Actinobacteria bacterium]|nr:MAG: ferrochelatase [Actinomycetota bacterium]